MSKRDDEEDEYPNRFSSDYEEDGSEFDAADEPRRGPLAFAIALGILLVVSAVIWNAYRQGTREGGRDGAPRITVEGPAKTVPNEPGGVTVPDQDVAVYDEIEEATAQGAAVAPKGVSGSELRPATSSPDDAPAAGGVPPAAASLPPGTGSASAPAAPVKTFAAASTTFAVVRQGPFVAQIAALRSESAANSEWTKLERQAPALFGQVQKDILRADLGAKGVFFRLRAGSFATRADASAFCDQLLAAGQGCIVAAR